MSVEPGFSGQTFLPVSLEKIKLLTSYRTQHKLNFEIAADGGINKHNLKLVVAAGAMHVAIAAGIFGQQNRVQALKELKNI